MSAASDALRAGGGAVLFVALGLGALFVQIAPAPQLPAGWRPDLFWAVLAFYMLRRPEAAPLGLVAVLLILRDALTANVPGLGALSLLAAAELLRARGRGERFGALGDWVAAALAYAVAMGLQWLALTLTFAPAPPLSPLAQHLAATALVMPPLAALLRYGLRVGRRPRAAEAA